MTTLLLSPAERKLKRAEAHHLNPVVSIGAEGATEAVRRELDAALDAHGLIKVRVFSDDRAAREVLFGELSAALSAAPVQHIGKLLVFWREPRPNFRRTYWLQAPGTAPRSTTNWPGLSR